MILNDFLKKSPSWLSQNKEKQSVVISSRIRIARNLANIPFPHRASISQKEEVIKRFLEAKEKVERFRESIFLRIDELSYVNRQFLIERHLISLDLAQNSKGSALLVANDELISVMINEEDHFRIQILSSGAQLKKLWQELDMIDDQLSEKLNFAFSKEWGYLTACPTNVGTGLRGSVMLHLPGLVLLKRINKVLHAISKLSFNTRGLFGEGTQAIGNLFQISNQISLGQNEIDILDNIEGVIKQVTEQELSAREYLLKTQKMFIKDKVWRAYGILKNSRIINSQEALELFSMLRLGLDLGIINKVNYTDLNELFLIIQPAHLQKKEGKTLNSQERDIKRAELIRSKL